VATTPPAAPAAPAIVAASSEVLPEIGTVAPARVNRLGPSPRQLAMPGVGRSKDAINALFGELTPGALGKHVYEGDGDSYVLIQLIDHATPKQDDFEKTAEVEISRLREARGKATVRDWLKNRCEVLTKAGKIRPAPERIRETDDKGNPAPTIYKPCSTFDYLVR
jgi:hypothetical protein